MGIRGTTGVSEMVGRVAKAIWEHQRARINNQDGINARLVWRDKSTAGLDPFWQSYEDDARAAITVWQEMIGECLK